MPAIKLTAFIGELPRILPRLLPDTAAQESFNLRLDDGGLTPTRLSVEQTRLEMKNIKTIYNHNGKWLSWQTIVHACPGAIAAERLYYTGDGAPKMRIGEKIYPLAVPRPDTALSASVSQDTKPEKPDDKPRDVFTRFYAYTFVTEFGEESEPSPLGQSIDWKDGQIIKLTGFKQPDQARPIDKQRIYRTQTGSSGTYLYFIAERNVSSADFIDNVGVDKFNEALPSASWNAPPDNLQGLTAMPNGMMAAFTGRNLYFSEPWHPHAWPQKYILSTDADIVALGAIGTMLIVLTAAHPYLCSGTSPDTMQMVKLEANYPCINACGVVDLGFCIVYPSHEGLVAVGADGGVRLITANLFNRDAWLALSPKTMVAGQISGRYIAFYSTVENDQKKSGAIYIDAGETPFLLRSGETACAVCYDVETGGLYFIRPDEKIIYRLDDPVGDRQMFYWRSKEFVLPYPENFGVILVETDRAMTGQEIEINQQMIDAAKVENAKIFKRGSVIGEINAYAVNGKPISGDVFIPVPLSSGTLTIGVIADGQRVAQINKTNIPQRLPGGFSAQRWEIDVSGDVTVASIKMAKTVDELKTTA